ncbi:MAG TPA: thrombospondin type 3 repeat-containing protein [Thermoanaerobaculia bacterium]|nr:thrombospondin type 3 repeat-containing protein [Thermoanaerobaculia bacterium]
MKKNVRRVFVLLAALGLSSTLLASVDIQKAFVAAYPDAKAKLGKCSTCHTAAMPKKETAGVNAYGKDMEKAFDKEKKVYDFKKIEALDSDGDGVKNLDEIKAGTNPGDKASK